MIVKFQSLLRSIIKDPRDFQLLFLSALLVYGIQNLGWEQNLAVYLITITFCLFVQLVAVRWLKLSLFSLKSALITALGLCLLLKSDEWWVIPVTAFLAIGSKFIIRWNGKHIFNPVNFGLIVPAIVTGRAWISPGQWGNSALLIFAVLALSSFLLLRVGRIDTTITFLASLFVLQYVRTVLYLGWPIDHLFHQFSNGTLLLFAFFMITDPMTTPNVAKARKYWAVLLALITFILSNWLQVYTAPIWALFLIAPATFMFDRLFEGEKYRWALD